MQSRYLFNPLSTQAQKILDNPLRLVQTIPLAGVQGRIDHLAVDLPRRRLFVCALGNNTVEVIDLEKAARVHTIRGLGAPQGAAYVPDLNRLFIANDRGGVCNIYDANSWQLIGKTDFQDDADNVRYDLVAKRIYVGFGSGGIGIINTADGKQLGSIKLSAHPEAFALEKQGKRIFVNVPNSGHVAVIDRDKSEMVATWKTGLASGNFPIALDEANHRLFVDVAFRRSSEYLTPIQATWLQRSISLGIPMMSFMTASITGFTRYAVQVRSTSFSKRIRTPTKS